VSKELLESQYDDINRLIAYAVYRYGLNAADAEEFRSLVYVKLVENDYKILKKFGNRNGAHLLTFLAVVIKRLCLDYRIAQWGKWRPSAEATRQGDLAVQLERLIYRNGFSFSEACQVLRTDCGCDLSDDALAQLWEQLPKRTPRRQVDDSELESMASDELDAESAAMQAEESQQAARLQRTLVQARLDLDPQDQLILQLRFDHSMTVPQVARTLGLEATQLYPRIQRILGILRRRLEDEGFGPGEIDGYFPPDGGGPPSGDDGKGLNYH
jgi:RNA polymerase sigma factor for flagellar operon FliA